MGIQSTHVQCDGHIDVKVEIVLLARLLLSDTPEKQEVIRQVQTLFQQHPDQAIFASLRGAGDLLQS